MFFFNKNYFEFLKDNADVETEEYAKLLTDTALINSGKKNNLLLFHLKIAQQNYFFQISN